jgi:5-methyltetrahydrofolate--homocysteine methyltransferase
VPYIDWSPFFLAWELRGRYPRILEDPIIGKEATRLFNDAQKMLAQILRDKPFTPRGVVGIFHCRREGDDVKIFNAPPTALPGTSPQYWGEDGRGSIHTLHFLRQQKKKENEQVYYCLADFIGDGRPTALPGSADPVASVQLDYIGGFAVTAGDGAGEYAARFEKQNDDYSAIMVKALADRFAEAFAEYAHELVRKHIWGYSADEQLDIEGLIREEYVGIRPAPGYPASPDHTEKRTLFDWLSVEKNTGIELTESFAMTPPSSVSGLYFAHPESKYFAVGKIDRDQLEDYAARKGKSVEEMERWLRPYLD